jgi:hypothetical protein
MCRNHALPMYPPLVLLTNEPLNLKPQTPNLNPQPPTPNHHTPSLTPDPNPHTCRTDRVSISKSLPLRVRSMRAAVNPPCAASCLGFRD